MARGALLVTSEERRRCEGKQRAGGPEDIWERPSRIGRTLIWEVVNAGVPQPPERLGGQRLPDWRRHERHGKLPSRAQHIVPVREDFRIEVYARPVSLTR